MVGINTSGSQNGIWWIAKRTPIVPITEVATADDIKTEGNYRKVKVDCCFKSLSTYHATVCLFRLVVDGFIRTQQDENTYTNVNTLAFERLF
jgi:hypothetical protein